MIRVIGGELRGRRLATPRDATVRPTASRVREALFDILQGIVPGARVLDLFAGSGALGIEALSRGASRATFVERSRASLPSLRRNIEELGLSERARIVASGADAAIATLASEGERLDLLLLDPPYADEPTSLLRRLAEAGLDAPGAVVVLELAARRRLADPEDWSCDRRRYGDTELLLLRRR